jgi:Sec-independent protein translocase protein TatA
MGKGIREFRGSIGGENDQDDVDDKRAELETSQTGEAKAETVDGEVVTENKA